MAAASVSHGRRRVGLFADRAGECRRRVVFCFERGEARASELLRPQVGLGPRNRRLGGGIFRRGPRARARDFGGSDGLPSIAHLLHGRAAAADEPENTYKYSDATHRVHGH